MIREAIMKLSRKEDLTYQEAEEVMNEIMEGRATDVQMSAYLTALSLKGETIDEITASAAGMRAMWRLWRSWEQAEMGPIPSIYLRLRPW